MSSSGGGRGPPRLAEILLGRVIRDAESLEGILGDIFEEFREVEEARSRYHAMRWYWWSALRLALRYTAEGSTRLRRRVSADRVIPRFRRSAGGAALLQDVRYASRALGHRAGLTAVLVLTLGMGIGASTTIFSVLNAVVLRPIPFEEPDRLVRLSEVTPRGVEFAVSQPGFLDYRARGGGVMDLAAVEAAEVTLLGEEDAELLSAGLTTSALFRVFRVRPVQGRVFTPAEEVPGEPARVAILSHPFWESRFGADPQIVGTTLRTDRGLLVVVGVMGDGFEILDGVDVWLPRVAVAQAAREDHRLQVFGRLRSGVSLLRGQEEARLIAAQLAEQYPASNEGWGGRLMSLPDFVVGPQVRLITVTLLAAVGLLLLLIGANVSNLLMARTSGRQKEFGVRSAMGAGQWGVVRQLLAESLLIGLMGAALGLVVAFALVPVVAGLPEMVPRLDEVDVDGTVLTFAVLVSIVEGLGVGLGSAFQATRWKVERALTETGGGHLEVRTTGR